jgi:hypothetical protein
MGALGDLRRTTDTELVREPNIGKKMLEELRLPPPQSRLWRDKWGALSIQVRAPAMIGTLAPAKLLGAKKTRC